MRRNDRPKAAKRDRVLLGQSQRWLCRPLTRPKRSQSVQTSQLNLSPQSSHLSITLFTLHILCRTFISRERIISVFRICSRVFKHLVAQPMSRTQAGDPGTACQTTVNFKSPDKNRISSRTALLLPPSVWPFDLLLAP